jgi:Holliday junction resolvasome RuvABC endonuclease subunit
MARITLDSIIQDVAQDNWKVISTEYKNLDTEMEFECAEGHRVFAPYKQIRTKRECPICKANKFKDVSEKVVPKKKGVQRTLALDQASHITGYSIYDGRELVTYGTYTARGVDEMSRLHDVNMWLISQIQQWQPDIVGIEGIQYQQQAGITTFQTLGRLQGILMETCTQAGIPFRICNTNTWRAHCDVKGRTRQDKKRSMQLLVKQWFDISVSDDCADAIGIGKYVSDNYVKQTEIINWEE